MDTQSRWELAAIPRVRRMSGGNSTSYSKNAKPGSDRTVVYGLWISPASRLTQATCVFVPPVIEDRSGFRLPQSTRSDIGKVLAKLCSLYNKAPSCQSHRHHRFCAEQATKSKPILKASTTHFPKHSLQSHAKESVKSGASWKKRGLKIGTEILTAFAPRNCEASPIAIQEDEVNRPLRGLLCSTGPRSCLDPAGGRTLSTVPVRC